MKKLIINQKLIEKKPVKNLPFSVSIQLSDANGNVVKKAKTVVECLNKIILKHQVKSKAIITVSHDGKASQRILRPFELKLLLAKDLNKLLFQKRMLSIMK